MPSVILCHGDTVSCLQAPLEFSNPVVGPDTAPNGRVTFMPRRGDFVIFPSFLSHTVPMRHLQRDAPPRISIAFNIWFRGEGLNRCGPAPPAAAAAARCCCLTFGSGAVAVLCVVLGIRAHPGVDGIIVESAPRLRHCRGLPSNCQREALRKSPAEWAVLCIGIVMRLRGSWLLSSPVPVLSPYIMTTALPGQSFVRRGVLVHRTCTCN